MKKIILILCLFAGLNSFANIPLTGQQNEKTWRWDNTTFRGYWATTYYVSTTGNDANAGTIGSPFANWEKLEEVMVAGDIGYIRGGTYTAPATANEYKVWIVNINGTAGSPCRIENYPGEVPVLDFTGSNFSSPGVYGPYFQYCNYLTIKGLKVTGLAQNVNGNAVNVFSLDNCNNVTIENCEVTNCGGSAFVLLHSNNNLILNCDASHCGDQYTVGGGGAWGGTNGFAITGDVNTSTNNTFRGCRAWDISDNGYAFFGSRGIVTLENCWAFRIGWQTNSTSAGGDGVGFKLGRGYDGGGQSSQVLRILKQCLSFENRFIGFDQNYNASYQFIAELYNCTGWQNGTNNTVGGYPYISGYNYDFHQGDRPYVLKNCIGYVSTTNIDLNAQSVQTTNSWQGFTVTNGDFVSLTSTGMDGARQSNGSLPDLTFLKLQTGSDLINAGTPVSGIAYNGSLPDLGAFETGGSANQNPISNAGIDQSAAITSCILNGSGSYDPDGTIVTYAWTKLSGPSCTILTPSAVTTTVTGLTQGVYQFQLVVTDDDGASHSDIVVVTMITTASRIINVTKDN